ncbi:hypothetical protein FRC09_018509 [Ceratobasidium sp. 395]|nr:hypothetical protein FRC09_018509 [Ceratobasidium sp. 395]
MEPHLDMRLKPQDVIPEWDGDPETLMKWLIDLEKLAVRGVELANQIPKMIPYRLKGKALQWFDQFSGDWQRWLMENWDDFKYRMSTHFWDAEFIAKQKNKALNATYRDHGNSRETPIDYLVRKKELLIAVFTWADVEIIAEVVRAAPIQWQTIVDHDGMQEWSLYFAKIKEKENLLQDWPHHERKSHVTTHDIREAIKAYKAEKKSKHQANHARAKVHAVNSTPPKPFKPFMKKDNKKPPPDDGNVTKNSKGTPQSRGMRGCLHCGSKMHYDYECKHKKPRNVKTFLAQATDEDKIAYANYVSTADNPEDDLNEEEPEPQQDLDSDSDSSVSEDSSDSDF